MAISHEKFLASATRLNIDVNALKAVAKVESIRGGFDKLGRLTVLFEPHIFWKYLNRAGVDPKPIKIANPDLVNPIWDKTLYGTTSKQWDKLDRAKNIHINAANLSASYGAFQIIGFNYGLCGFSNVDSFINFLSQGEDNQLDIFCNYLNTVQLVEELAHKDWAGFARGYNGKYYWKNQYDIKLKNAYAFFKNNQ